MSKERQVYEFNNFRLDPGERLLLRDGEEITLPSKAFDLLTVLVGNSGRLIEKDELYRRVWADQAVEESNLTVQMSAIRKALGEDRHHPRYIATVAGHGYRFVADVAKIDSDDLVIETETVSRLIIASEMEQNGSKDPITLSQFGAASLGADDVNTAVRKAPLSLSPGVKAVAAATVLVVALVLLFFFLRSKQTTPGAAASSAQIKSIAVLPFKPLVADDRDESLEMGMADTLIAKLSNLREVTIRPINSVRKYANPEQDAVAAGREQKVEAVLDGSIQKSGDKIRTTVRLVRVADGAVLWTGQFDEKLTDIFVVQDSISQRVATALSVTLAGREKERLLVHHTENPDAYQLYLKGRYQLNRLTDDGFLKGRDYFQQAIDRDPKYALAFAGLADAYNMLGDFNVLASKEVYPKARDAATKALGLDESLAEAHAALGVVKFSYDWEFSAAEREFQRAIELNPSNSDAHKMNAHYLATVGRFDEALREMKRAQELDPLSLELIAGIGEVLYFQRQYDQAIDQYQKALEMDVNSGFAYWALGRTLAAKGKYSEAIAALQKSIPLSGDSPDEPAELARTYALAGRRQETMKILNELTRLSEHKHVSPAVIAAIYGALGDKQQAFAWINKAFEMRDFILVLLKVEPMFDPLRNDARFAALAQKVGLPQ